ncbi:hypothetical protein FC32_GL001730 [Ligilactobacillus apodemi DSM 16634 = JCM 16172]|uniref:UPF0246 protein FC32_GL001730 n=1 Tax=Ligilactobacillus apodemi DSM 16634 = JCM 16172 TaxID=1423724 RepID=A0A0R1UC78_9LACO|nr:hypothetical protein FC32_GL001730 [Ligilactobacillus apodemi DSM 16634 = JCM 16172]
MKTLKIIISPAKKMYDATADFSAQTKPVLLSKAQTLFSWLQGLSYEQVKEVWQCSEKLAMSNYQELQSTKLTHQVTPALFSYVGLQYSSLAPDLLTRPDLDYLAKNLRILSGLYGILRPFDGIVKYRLEMGAKIDFAGAHDLYHFWGQDLYDELFKTGEPVVNLASKEYAKVITKYLEPTDIFITCEFKEYDPKRQKLVQKATHAKQARGQFVRYLAEKKVEDLIQLQNFNELGYRFEAELSNDTTYIFVKRE